MEWLKGATPAGHCGHSWGWTLKYLNGLKLLAANEEGWAGEWARHGGGLAFPAREFEVLSGRCGAEQSCWSVLSRGCPVSGHSEEGAKRRAALLETTREWGKWLNPSSRGLTRGCGVWEGGKGCPGGSWDTYLRGGRIVCVLAGNGA